MNIAIIGTRGIPNNYGGFEQFAEYISVGLAERGHKVTVYNPHFHPYKQPSFKNVTIRTMQCPENKLGSAAHFYYDYLCLRDALKQDFDIIYAAGYGTQAPSMFFVNGYADKLVVNMDGLEWKRSKWGFFTQKLMKMFERVTVKRCKHLVSDNLGVQSYFRAAYNKNSYFLAYGADVVKEIDRSLLKKYGREENAFYLLIARLEPENNIDEILSAHQGSNTPYPLLVIGNHETKYGQWLKQKYAGEQRIVFLGSIYAKDELDTLRACCIAYYHGHSVGGTNPSLLEAMAAGSFVIAHDNDFNRSVLQNNALFFPDTTTLKGIINDQEKHLAKKQEFIERNRQRIATDYAWDHLVQQHENLFESIVCGNPAKTISQ